MKKPARQTRKQQYELIARAQSGDLHAADLLIEGNTGLITRIAGYYNGRCTHMEFADLVQEGKIGMLQAIQRFDLARRIAFSTYASIWVKQGIYRAIQTKEHAISLPDYALARQAKDYHNGIQTDLPKVFYILDDPMPASSNFNGFERGVRAIDLQVAPGNVEDETIGRTGEGFDCDPLSLVGRLEETERLVLTQRLGLDGNGIRTLTEIGAKIGRSREGVRQIQRRAITNLRRMVREGAAQ